jgi:hypothetical protein
LPNQNETDIIKSKQSGGNMKKTSLILIFLAILFSQVHAGVLPQEYYDLKSQLVIESEWGKSVGGIKVSKEKDSEVLCMMADILDKYQLDNDEVVNERDFVRLSLTGWMPVDEYSGDKLEDRNAVNASDDDYSKCPEPKRKYLLMFRRWGKEFTVKYFIDLDNTAKNAVRMTDAISKLRTKRTYSEGIKDCNELFDEGVFNVSFIYWYLDTFYSDGKDYRMINKFYKKYFDKIPAKAFDEYQVGPMMRIIVDQSKKVKIEAVNKLLDKVNNSPDGTFGIEKCHGGTNDVLMNIFCDEDVINEPGLKTKVLDFFRINKKILNNKDLFLPGTKQVKDFLILNSDNIGISAETIKMIENPYLNQ